MLALAEDPSQPLLERAKFLSIFASNLDEFYMVRVAGLKRRDQAGLAVRGADGLTPREQLTRISARTQELAHKHARVFLDEIAPALDAAGVHLIDWSQVTESARPRLSDWFARQVFPVLTPLAVDPAHPFPYISNQSLNLAVAVHDPQTGTEHFARVKVPNNVPRLVRVGPEPDEDSPADSDRQAWFLPIEDLIAENLDQLFEGMNVVEHHVFRVTRNADLEVEEDRDEDLLQALERELARRRFGPPVRLEITDTMSEHMLELLLRELDVDPHDVVQVPGRLDLSALMELLRLNRPDLKDPVFVPAKHPAFSEGETPKSVFATLREGDVLVHHPYDSFSTSVHRFIEQAAVGPEGAGDQADALPHLGRLADRRVADRRRRGRQAGRRGRGDQGPLRRARQHRVGPRPGARGRPRRLRPRGPQDPLQGRARRAPGGLDDQAVLPPGHRQLQPEDRAPLRGHRRVHRRRDDRRRPHRPVQRAHRLRPAHARTASCWSPRTGCGAASSSASTPSASAPSAARPPASGSRSTVWSTSR